MKASPLRLLVGLIFVGVGVWLMLRSPTPPPATPATAPAPAAGGSHSPGVSPTVSPLPAADGSLLAEPPFEGIEKLNSPTLTITDDLNLLRDLFQSWQVTFPHVGNPVGSNQEITAALTGLNPLRYALVPRNHPAINAERELTDRWGTPFFFHQLSGARMEIRSAGPDRRLHTADDTVLTP